MFNSIETEKAPQSEVELFLLSDVCLSLLFVVPVFRTTTDDHQYSILTQRIRIFHYWSSSSFFFFSFWIHFFCEEGKRQTETREREMAITKNGHKMTKGNKSIRIIKKKKTRDEKKKRLDI